VADELLIRAERGGQTLVRYREMGDGTWAQVVAHAARINELAFDVNGNLEYIGYAPIDASAADAKWQIRKLFHDASGNLLRWRFADDNPRNEKVWDDRASYVYS
jgi:hypothetical protein